MMKRFLPVLLLFVGLTASACGLLSEPEAASAPIEAVPLEAAAETDTAPAESAPSEPTDAAPAADTGVETAVSQATLYTISQADSEVRFELDEDLRGSRITVVGITDQVAGELAVDLADLSTVQIGTLQINARTLQTDNNFRNRAIQNEILDTGDYEFITFTPTNVTGLPDSAAIGDAISFTIEGELTIRDTTVPASFDVTATAVSDTQLSGTASTTINREAFGLTIPSVPNVANVEEEVELYINFVANAS